MQYLYLLKRENVLNQDQPVTKSDALGEGSTIKWSGGERGLAFFKVTVMSFRDGSSCLQAHIYKYNTEN